MVTSISAESISKHYRLGAGSAGKYRTVRESISSAANKSVSRLRSVFQKSSGSCSTYAQHRALRDVSFEIKSGEAVGIIGNNGGGKSTLLKVLSRITSPTSGRVKLWGASAACSKLGRGFIPS